MNDLVQLTRSHDNIAVITINNPPVNALSPGVPEGISEAIDQIVKDEMVKAAVVIGAGRTFVAGADIKEFEKMTSRPGQRGPALLPLLLKIENCSKPVVMAIHGTALGGGLELAMAGHYRVAAPNAQVGQPVLPGARALPRAGRAAVGADGRDEPPAALLARPPARAHPRQPGHVARLAAWVPLGTCEPAHGSRKDPSSW